MNICVLFDLELGTFLCIMDLQNEQYIFLSIIYKAMYPPMRVRGYMYYKFLLRRRVGISELAVLYAYFILYIYFVPYEKKSLQTMPSALFSLCVMQNETEEINKQNFG